MSEREAGVPMKGSVEPVEPPSAVPETYNVVASLLKAPQNVSGAIADRGKLIRSGTVLLLFAVFCHAVFGFAVGLFGGLPVAIMDMVKAPLVAISSLLLCFPSLYIFACVGGSPLTLSQAYMLGASCLAMVGLLLVGLAPVAWLFAVSTESIPFVAVLTLLIWLIAAAFAVRFVRKLQTSPLFQRTGGIKLWFLVLALVTLQMTTTMRPILSKPDKSWWTDEKKFFLSHFGSTLEHKESSSK